MCNLVWTKSINLTWLQMYNYGNTSTAFSKYKTKYNISHIFLISLKQL